MVASKVRSSFLNPHYPILAPDMLKGEPKKKRKNFKTQVQQGINQVKTCFYLAVLGIFPDFQYQSFPHSGAR